MRAGTRWTYEAQSEVCQADGVVVTNNTVSSCEVLDTYNKGAVIAARVRGFPLAMDVWSAGTNVTAEVLLVRISASQYHLVDVAAVARLAAPDDFLLNLVADTTLFLDCPLVGGKRFGEFEQLTRPDPSYFWYVESEQQRRTWGVRGVSPWRARTTYTLTFDTCPDTQRVVFVPGIGIVEYTYHHNGTPCDFRMRLKTFREPD